MKRVLLTVFTLGIFSADVVAQSLQEVVVTAMRRTGYNYDLPAVTVKKNADFLVQSIEVSNDSRSEELRKKEILETINNLLRSAGQAEGIELSYGEGFLVPVNVNDESLRFEDDSDYVDSNYVEIYVKIALDGDRDPKEQIADLRKFIADAGLVGRTEIDASGRIGLSIIDPGQYRYEIIQQISEENRRVEEQLAGDCMTVAKGLADRVRWVRSDIAELTLYIDYSTDITCN